MRALRFTGRLEYITDAELARPAAETLVQVVCAGICGTDLEITRGYAGFHGTLGHEFVGRILESPRADLIGKRVVGEINAGCGDCPDCRMGDSRHCPSRTVLGIKGRDGAFADTLSLPGSNLFALPDSIDNDQAVFVEPLAAALRIIEQAGITRSSRVAVLGDGRLAQLILRVLSQYGCELTCIGKHAAKLDLARAANARTIELSQVTSGFRTFDVVVDATGSPSGLPLALDLVRAQGTVVLKSTHHAETPVPLSGLVVNEVRVIGSRCGRFGPAIELMESGTIDVRPLISARLPLARGIEAFALASKPDTLKVLIQVS
jgi:alcohol dehydrogenase